jgi:hypothetical protein
MSRIRKADRKVNKQAQWRLVSTMIVGFFYQSAFADELEFFCVVEKTEFIVVASTEEMESCGYALMVYKHQ